MYIWEKPKNVRLRVLPPLIETSKETKRNPHFGGTLVLRSAHACFFACVCVCVCLRVVFQFGFKGKVLI